MEMFSSINRMHKMQQIRVQHTYMYIYIYIYPILHILPVVFFHMRSVRYSVIFHSRYLMLNYACAVPVEYRINRLSHSFHVRYCETFHEPKAREIPRHISHLLV